MALIFCDQEEKAKSLTEIPVLRRLSHRANANSLTPLGFLLSKKSKPLLVKVIVSPVPCSLQATLPNTISNIKEYNRTHQDKNNATEKRTKARTGNLEEKRNK